MIDGGLFTRGYQTFVVLPHATEIIMDERRPYVILTPAPNARSSANIASIRIYTDQAGRFPRH
jgi:hypothetical protein